MGRDTLTGSRIRERRMMAGMKQADLARAAGISASYLNLIEHNRRRIGGKLLNRIAQILGLEPSQLSEGAAASLIASLREAAAKADRPAPAEDAPRYGDLSSADEFAGRFPGWAQLLADSQARIARLERTISTLSDRMTHDPHLAASLHEMLSTVTAIRSTASILVEPGEIAPEWQARFHRNLSEESARLTEASAGLVTYLERNAASGELGAPQEEVDAVLAAHRWQFPELETQGADAAARARALGADLSAPARALLGETLALYAADAARLPAARLAELTGDLGPEPFAIAAAAGLDVAVVMRRMAALGEDGGGASLGFAACDGSGVLTARKPLADFSMPRFGAGCPLWPLYTALTRPMSPVVARISQAGGTGRRYRALAFAAPSVAAGATEAPLFAAQMLLIPEEAASGAGGPVIETGVNCRICPRNDCAGRREPSILTQPT